MTEQELLEVMRAFQTNETWEEDDATVTSNSVISVDRSAPREKISAKEIDPSKYGLKPFDTLFDELDEDEPAHSPSVSHAKEMMRRGEELRSKSSQVLFEGKGERW